MILYMLTWVLIRYSLMVMSRPIPMLFMGSETLQGGWWHPDGHHHFQWDLLHDPHAIAMMAMVWTQLWDLSDHNDSIVDSVCRLKLLIN